MKTLTFRIKPGADLKSSIENIVKEHGVTAGFIITCVGGLERATVRMAGAQPDTQDIRTFDGNYEIVSLTGTVSTNGMHLHMSFSDTTGRVHGGHLKGTNIVHPTAEIVIGYNEDQDFSRQFDPDTGFDELVVNA